MSKQIKLLGICFLVLMGSATVSAQTATDTTTIWMVETDDENEFIGTILSRNSQELQIKTERLGVITIQMKNVKRIEPINSAKLIDGQFWFENPQAARYFWAPNGYALRKGEGYYQNAWIFFNQLSVGLSDNFTIGIGTVPLFLFGGGPTPVWLTPKVSFPIEKDKFNVGAGALIGTVLGESNTGFGIAYGVTTFGSRDKNVNIGLGYGFADGQWSNSPTLTLSAMIRTGRRGYFLTENYLIGIGGETLGIISGGGRYVGKKISFDYGLGIPLGTGIDTFFAIPWLGIAVPFGQKVQ